MIVADLHVHTDNSDGTLSLSEVPAAAEAAGLDAVAITDHDRSHPDLDAPVVEREGVTLIHGIELRVDAGEQRLDLLGYGLDPTPDLRSEIRRLQQNRVDRGRRIIERVEDRLGVDLDLEPVEGFGRPHVARAVVDHPETEYDDTDAVFADLIGNEGPCYVARDVPTFERGRELLDEACALVGLAHPLRASDPAAALERAADLDAVEFYYRYGREVDEAPVEAAIEDHDLLATGGSDAHGTTLGIEGLDADAFEPVTDALRL